MSGGMYQTMLSIMKLQVSMGCGAGTAAQLCTHHHCNLLCSHPPLFETEYLRMQLLPLSKFLQFFGDWRFIVNPISHHTFNACDIRLPWNACWRQRENKCCKLFAEKVCEWRCLSDWCILIFLSWYWCHRVAPELVSIMASLVRFRHCRDCT